ncbi:MAG TPA: T9SS type A sorting domain-containing protein, partial [Cyclobacteriaceae bacterium]|nr:T9SS type A sorting domain-containing protein [Cyclobacteriaceae bacterium]
FRITTGFQILSENVRLINTLGQNIPIKLQADSSSVIVYSGSISPGIYILQVNRGYWRQSVRVVIE